jgi:hypothetical protein
VEKRNQDCIVRRVIEKKEDFFLTELGEMQVTNYKKLGVNPYLNIFVTSWIRVLTFFSYRPVKKKITLECYDDAMRMDKFPEYLKTCDVLNVFENDVLNPEIFVLVGREQLQIDYYKYIRLNYSPKSIAQLYLNYLERSSRLTSMGDIDYEHFTTDFYYKSFAQKEQYNYVLDQFDRIILPSDGLGVASCMCILKEKEYMSWEPKAIGTMAYNLGIITSTEPIYDRSYVYCFFYCVQYYQLPFMAKQRYVVWDIPAQKKPGIYRNDVCSTNIRHFLTKKWDKTHRVTHMVIDSFFPLDNVTDRLLTTYGYKKKEMILAQYLVASTMVGLEVALVKGFFSKEFWKKKKEDYDKLIEICKNEHSHIRKNGHCKFLYKIKYLMEMTVEQIINIMQEKTLLFTERTFPFRVKNKLKKVSYKHKRFVREYGSGNYFLELSMYRGNDRLGHYVATDYELLSGKFVLVHTRPEIVKYIRLRAEHKLMYNKEIVKVFLLSTYYNKVKNKYFAIYVDDREARPIMTSLIVT